MQQLTPSSPTRLSSSGTDLSTARDQRCRTKGGRGSPTLSRRSRAHRRAAAVLATLDRARPRPPVRHISLLAQGDTSAVGYRLGNHAITKEEIELMGTRSKILLGALTAAIVLAAAIGTASARRLEVSEQRIRVTWTELVFSNSGAAPRISCPVTIQGSFHSKTLSKVSGQLIGVITKAELTKANCRGGTALILNGIENAPGATSLPWHIRYDSFSGTLPIIEGGIKLQLINASFLVEPEGIGVACLFRSTEARPARGIAAVNGEHKITTLSPTADTIPKLSGGLLCPSSGSFEGPGIVSSLEAATLIFVRLVQ